MTVIHSPDPRDLERRRAAILRDLGLTDEELRSRVREGGLTGVDWLRWAEIEEIDYLLGHDES